MKTIADKFVVQRQAMICGSAEAEARQFTIAVDKRGCVWFYTLTDPDPGGHVYVHNPNDEKSDGFAGRIITFKIGKCGTYAAKGPWHGNSDSLFANTGVDLRDKNLTFGVISLGRAYENHNSVLTDIIYMDDKPTLGLFDRTDIKAQQMASDLNTVVYYYSESGSGSSSGPVKPESWTQQQYKEYFEQQRAVVQVKEVTK